MKSIFRKLKDLFDRLFQKERAVPFCSSEMISEENMEEKELIENMTTETEEIPQPEMIPVETEIPEETEDKKKKKKKAEYFINRELSWLDFAERVLEEAEDTDSNPLCERLNFLSIYQSNMDEFFKVRTGALINQMTLDDHAKDSKSDMRPSEQLKAVYKKIRKLGKRDLAAYEELMDSLRGHGVRVINFAMLEKNEAAYLEAYFKNEVMPLLSGHVISEKQAIPFMNSEDLYAFCMLDSKTEKNSMGIVPCTIKSLPRLIRIPGHTGEYMLSEELVLHFMKLVFPGYTVGEKAVIRITRNADIDAEQMFEDDMDYRELMEQLIISRKRLSPVRLEYSREMSEKTVKRLADKFMLKSKQAFLTEVPLDLSFLSNLSDDLRAKTELFYEKRQPQKSTELDEDLPIMDQIRKKDVLLYYPYERMNPMLDLLSEAARDPEVESIQMTLYRVAKNSQIVESLITAAEKGKTVNVLVELKARFDEENNIAWSRMLEDGGCNVVYGLGRFKVHSKLLLITRKNGKKKEYFTQIGTGNYNEKTAKIYTDLCLMTADRTIAADAEKVFEALMAGEIPEGFEKLLVAPFCLKNPVLDMIDREIGYAKNGEDAYIGLKMNSLSDKKIMKKLIEASEAGVKIDMIVRGVNCLRSQLEGKTENIRIISIVGRYLEHARVYVFGTEEREKIYISSADFMTRNTDKRVEVAAPVEDPELRKKIRRILELQLRDNVKARVQKSSGSYEKAECELEDEKINSQEAFVQLAYEGKLG